VERNAINVGTLSVPEKGNDKDKDVLKVGVIGYGTGVPISYAISAHDHAAVAMVCDSNPATLSKVLKNYPQMRSLPTATIYYCLPTSTSSGHHSAFITFRPRQKGSAKRKACIR